MKKSLVFSLMILLILAACAPAPGQIPPAPSAPGSTSGLGQAISAADRGTAWAGHTNPDGTIAFAIGQKPSAKTSVFYLDGAGNSVSSSDNARAVVCPNTDLEVVLNFAGEQKSLLWNKLYVLENVDGVDKWRAIDLVTKNADGSYVANFGGNPFVAEDGNVWLTGAVNAEVKIAQASVDASQDDSGNIYVAAYSCKNYGTGIKADWRCGCDSSTPLGTDGKPVTQCPNAWRLQNINVGDNPVVSDVVKLNRYEATDGKFHYTFDNNACDKPADIKPGTDLSFVANFYSTSSAINKQKFAVYLCDGGKYVSHNLNDPRCAGVSATDIKAFYPSNGNGNHPFYQCEGVKGSMFTGSAACDGSWDYSLTTQLPNVIGQVDNNALFDLKRCNIAGSFHYVSLDGSTCNQIDTGTGIKTGTIENSLGLIYKYPGTDRVALNECRTGLEIPYVQSEECVSGAKKHILGYVLSYDVTDKTTSLPLYRCSSRNAVTGDFGVILSYDGVLKDSFVTTSSVCEGSINHFLGSVTPLGRVLNLDGAITDVDRLNALNRCRSKVGTTQVGTYMVLGNECTRDATSVLEANVGYLYAEQRPGTHPIYQCWDLVTSAANAKTAIDINDCMNLGLPNVGYKPVILGYASDVSQGEFNTMLNRCKDNFISLFMTTTSGVCENTLNHHMEGPLGFVKPVPATTKPVTLTNCVWTDYSTQGIDFILPSGKFIKSAQSRSNGGTRVQVTRVEVCDSSDVSYVSPTVLSDFITVTNGPGDGDGQGYCPVGYVPAGYSTSGSSGDNHFTVTMKCQKTTSTFNTPEFITSMDRGIITCPDGKIAIGLRGSTQGHSEGAFTSLWCSDLPLN